MLSSYSILINAITNGVEKILCFQNNVMDIKPSNPMIAPIKPD